MSVISSLQNTRSVLKRNTLSLYEQTLPDKTIIFWILVDNKNTSTNTITFEFGDDIAKVLDVIEKQDKCKGVILCSAKKSFIVGANISAILRVCTDKQTTISQLEKYHSLMQRVKSLKYTTVALINGMCLGGGLELCLACDYRLCTDEKLLLGFPEVKLGILPGMGGCVYTPKLIGLIPALDMIISGKMMKATKALKLGLIDKIVDNKSAIDEAIAFAAKKKRTIRTKRSLGNLFATSELGRAIMYNQVTKSLHVNTKLKFPAPYWILEVILKAHELPEKKALEAERLAFAHLLHTDVAQNLMRLFLVQDGLKKQSKVSLNWDKPSTIGVVGAGLMGAGIAQLLLVKGFSVVLVDTSKQLLGEGLKRIKILCKYAEENHIIEKGETEKLLAKLTQATSLDALEGVEFVIEAATEDLSIKQDILQKIDSKSKHDYVFATNTSSIPLSTIVNTASSRAKKCTVGFQFGYPAHKVTMIEIVRGKDTSEEVLNKVCVIAKAIDKVPVTVNDCTGFAMNRLLYSLLTECLYMIDEGYPVGIVQYRLGYFGFPIHLFTFLDAIGIDVFYQVLQNLCKHYPKRFKMSQAIQQLYDLKCYGRKTRSGFCEYTIEGTQAGYSKTTKEYLEKVRSKTFQDNVIERIIFRMFNEATYLLDEKIVDSEASIDFISIAALSFPPETGGLMNMFRNWKRNTLIERLKALESKYGKRFGICEWITKWKGGKGEVKNDNLLTLTPAIDLQVFPKPRNLKWIWIKYLFIVTMIAAFVLYYFLASRFL